MWRTYKYEFETEQITISAEFRIGGDQKFQVELAICDRKVVWEPNDIEVLEYGKIR